jgi:hypothetical protein
MEFVVAGIFNEMVLWPCLGLLGGLTVYTVFGPAPDKPVDSSAEPLVPRERPERKKPQFDCVLRGAPSPIPSPTAAKLQPTQ